MLIRNNHRLSIAGKKIGKPSELDKLEKLIVRTCTCSFTKLAQLHWFMLLHDVKILSGENFYLKQCVAYVFVVQSTFGFLIRRLKAST